MKFWITTFILITSIVSLSALNYQDAWDEIEALEQDGLYKSALEKVELLVEFAKTNNHQEQLIKAVIFKLNYISKIEGEFNNILFHQLKEFTESSSSPASNIFHILLSRGYSYLLNANYYKFSDRTDIENPSDDVETWTTNQLYQKVIEEITLAIENANILKQSDITSYSVIINEGSNNNLRPTLYDFIINQAIEIIDDTMYENDSAGETYYPDESDLFNLPAELLDLEIQTEDSLSKEYLTIKLYIRLIEFHLNDEDKVPLLDTYLAYLNYIYWHSRNDNKDELFEQSLKKAITEYSNNEYSAEIGYKLADFYYSKNKSTNISLKDSINYNEMALNLCRDIMDLYPNTSGADKSYNLMQLIERKDAFFKLEGVYLPNEPIMAKLNYRNVEGLYYRIYRIDEWNKSFRDDDWKDYLNKEVVKEDYIKLKNEYDYNEHSTEIYLGELDKGRYVIFVSHKESFNEWDNILNYRDFTVSNIAYLIRENENYLDIQLFERKSGQPLDNVNVEIWVTHYTRGSYSEHLVENYPADFDKGYTQVNIPISGLKEREKFYFKFIKDDDQIITKSFSNYSHYSENREQQRVYFFTDRKIYRPGQTIQFKGVAIKKDGFKSEPLVNEELTVFLFDPNYQEIDTQTFVTNEFGSFSGIFDIPRRGLTGNFIISSDFGDHYISVEEYKPPKFTIEFNPVDKAYVFGDSVTIDGVVKAFAGFNISNAKVAYSIEKSDYFVYGFRMGSEIISHGNTETDNNGLFSITFLTDEKDKNLNGHIISYSYKINVNITDINGETRSASTFVNVGVQGFTLDLMVPTNIDISKGKEIIEMNAENFNGKEINCSGSIEIYRLATPENIIQEKMWKNPDRQFIPKPKYKRLFPYSAFYNENEKSEWQVLEKVKEFWFNTEKDTVIYLDGLSSIGLGEYKIIARTFDDQGNEITDEKIVTFYNSKSTALPYPMADFFIPIKAEGEPGDDAQFLIGSSFNNTEVLFEQERDGIYKKKWITLDDEQKIITVPISEKDRGNIIVHFTFIKENRMYNHVTKIKVPWSNKDLDIEFMTFRDQLAPGEHETWSIKIKDHLGDDVVAEFAAALYDESLDQFAPNNWDLKIYSHRYSKLRWVSQETVNGSRRYVFYDRDKKKIEPITYPYFRHKISYFDRLAFARASKFMVLEQPDVMPGGMSDMEDVPSDNQNIYGSESAGDLSESYDMSGIEVRSDFNETAFFYPQLKTDDEGNIIFAFNMPQTLTRWKMMGLAHTKDLKIGKIIAEVETKKDLMIIPDAPRFFREGDDIEFTAKITNLSAVALDGVADLELFDAATMASINDKFRHVSPQTTFAVKPGENTIVKWKISIPENLSAVTYRILAKSGNFSDGEEKVIPILSNRMLVTESLPLPVREGQTRSFQFTKLKESNQSESLKHHKLTLEYTSNPTWYAIQALSYLMEYPYECSEQIFSRYYANSIASHIVNTNSKIKRVFDLWKNTDSSDALLSNLEKNQDLKTLLLEEAPWVMEAENESERKMKIGLLFDINRMSMEQGNALDNLQEAQSKDGGWPWFKGMSNSRYITQHIISGLGHLQRLGVESFAKDSDVGKMIRLGLKYLDNEIVEDYQWLIKNNVDLEADNLGRMQIQYLYGRSFFENEKGDEKSSRALNYYLDQAEKYWLNKSIYMQGMMALALYRNGRINSAEKITASLEERVLYSEEMGSYFREIKSGYYWYQAPVETQALLIEMFDEITANDSLINNMKVWLLKQKQVQDWKTTKATVEAVYALLLKGTDYLSETTLPVIKLGGEFLDLENNEDIAVESGTGYFKTSWNGSEITPEMGEIEITNRNELVSWGALYWQYFEDLDKITSQETPLKLYKTLYIERVTDAGKILELITSKNLPKIGDRIIVRIELRVDRDMEYIHMKDMRASCLEPENIFSQYKWQDGLGYYENTRDASTNFFFEYLDRGTYIFEYPLRVTHSGDFSNGITTIQSMYAPEYTSHSEGVRLITEEENK